MNANQSMNSIELIIVLIIQTVPTFQKIEPLGLYLLRKNSHKIKLMLWSESSDSSPLISCFTSDQSELSSRVHSCIFGF